MSAVFEKKENNKVSFTFELEVDEFERALQEAYNKSKGKFNIPGFRKGKVPRKIIELNYGEEIFYEDAINLLLPEAYDNSIKELELEPVDNPDIDIKDIVKGETISVKVEVDVKPEVKLGDYKSIELEKIEYNVTDEMVDHELSHAQEDNARLISVDREVEEGDLLTINFDGYLDGEQFPGGKAEGYELEVGSNVFIPGFENQLIGKNKDQDIDVNVVFPDEYHEETLAGKDVVFKVLIHDIKKKELPELDDEFAKDISEFDTLDEYKLDIKTRLEEELKAKERAEQENAIVDKVMEISEIDIPNGMIESQIDDELRQFDLRMRNQGLDLENYLQITGSKIEDMREQFRPIAEKRVRADLVLEAISIAEGIEVTEEDIDNELVKIAEQYNAEDVDAFIADMKKGSTEFLKAGISNGKVIDYLKEKVVFI